MSNSFTHRSIWKTSDAIFGITLFLGLTLHFVPSLSLAFPFPVFLRIAIGVVLVLVGATVVILA